MSAHEPQLREYLPLIGELAVDSARLEWGLVVLYAILQPNTGFSEGFHIPQDKLIKEIKRAVKRCGSWKELSGPELISWVVEASRLLKQRGEIMHSSWIVGTASETGTSEVYRTHHRTQSPALYRLRELKSLVERQHAHMATYPEAYTMAVRLIQPTAASPPQAK
jgi:hypothetical protein